MHVPRLRGLIPKSLFICALFAPLYAQQQLKILLPERTRLLQDQRIDLVIEARNVTGGTLKVTANNEDISSRFRASTADLDCDSTQDTVYRADLQSFTQPGLMQITATLNGDSGTLTDSKTVRIYRFTPASKPRNVVLYIGDAMGTAYRDATRLVYRTMETAPGVAGLREGFFDNLLEMDKMPVSGMVMTYAIERVIPDSANTASAWSNGNKTFEGALNVFADGTDCVWHGAGLNASNLSSVLDNPRVETLWEYLKRKYNYRTGVVTTAYVEDATPAGEGAHTAQRAARFEVARQYLENPMLNNQPVFDVILGGGKDEFDSDIRADGRDLVAEFQAKGYRFISTNSELRSVTAANGKLLGLFRRSNDAARHSSGIRSKNDANMEVAYDKLGLPRPASEPTPDFGTWTDQPFLEVMTEKAISVLSGPDGSQPFILMVEGASVDKQSHPNHAAGTIWDGIELDKAVGVGRRFAAGRKDADTLLLVTADHDQSMSIIGVSQTPDSDYLDHSAVDTLNYNSGSGAQKAMEFKDVHSNVRATYPYTNPNDPNSAGKEGAPAYQFQQVYAEGFPNYAELTGTGYPSNQQSGNLGTRRLSVGFRTGNHTGSSVPVTAEGPGAFLFTGYMDQTDLMFKMATSLTGDTAEGDAFVKNVLLNSRYPATFGK